MEVTLAVCIYVASLSGTKTDALKSEYIEEHGVVPPTGVLSDPHFPEDARNCGKITLLIGSDQWIQTTTEYKINQSKAEQ